MSHDLLIRNALIVDGSGAEPFHGDVAVRDGRIAAIGKLDGAARDSIDAQGLALAPGIVDLHTHYDAQVTWDRTCSPSPSLGVTTAVIGNCGFGIAPCPPPLRETVMKNLSVVEGMDLDALLTGVRWNFESFPQYMQMLRDVGPYLNLAVFAGHSVIRTAVMGDEACSRREVSADELATMTAMVREAMQAGAIGFASSFSPNHSGYGGVPMPSTIASDEELAAMVGVLGEVGRGVFMSATGPRATPDYMERLAQATGRPMFISTVLSMYHDAAPDRGLQLFERCAQAIDRGHEVYIQTSCQPLSFDFDMQRPYVFYSHPAFEPVKANDENPDALRAIYADPSMRERFRENLRSPGEGILFYGDWSTVEVSPALPEHAAMEQRSVAQLAAQAGKDPVDWLFDFVLSENLATRLIGKFYNNKDAGVARLLKHRAGVVTLSDAGAHLTYLCDAGFGLHMLGHWVRETGTFTLQEAVRRLTSHPADLYRIPGRGRIAQGAFADLLLFDPATVGIGKLRAVDDLPGGGRRMIRDGIGVHGVWVNGQMIWDGSKALDLARGPGQVLDRFDS